MDVAVFVRNNNLLLESFISQTAGGNQMFIYACAHSLAKAKNLEYCLSEIGYLKYFNLSKEDYQKNNFKYLLFRFFK